MTRAEFEQACALLPEDTYWGDELTIDMALHIRARARAELIAEMRSAVADKPLECAVIDRFAPKE